MRTTIPWGDGSGDNIYLDYTTATGDQTILVSSDANGTGITRTKDIVFNASGVSSVTLTVRQYSENTDIVIITRNDVYPTYDETAVGYMTDTPTPPTPTIQPIQIVTNGDFSEGLTGWTKYSGCGASVQSEGIRVTKNSGSMGAMLYQSPATTISSSSKYYQKVIMRKGTAEVNAGFCKSDMGVGNNTQMNSESTTWDTLDQITSPTGSANKIVLRCGSSATSSGMYGDYKSFMIIDLTATFGAGNEPTTVEECRELFPNDYYPTKIS
jgi:hypothetical protein